MRLLAAFGSLLFACLSPMLTRLSQTFPCCLSLHSMLDVRAAAAVEQLCDIVSSELGRHRCEDDAKLEEGPFKSAHEPFPAQGTVSGLLLTLAPIIARDSGGGALECPSRAAHWKKELSVLLGSTIGSPLSRAPVAMHQMAPINAEDFGSGELGEHFRKALQIQTQPAQSRNLEALVDAEDIPRDEVLQDPFEVGLCLANLLGSLCLEHRHTWSCVSQNLAAGSVIAAPRHAAAAPRPALQAGSCGVCFEIAAR